MTQPTPAADAHALAPAARSEASAVADLCYADEEAAPHLPIRDGEPARLAEAGVEVIELRRAHAEEGYIRHRPTGGDETRDTPAATAIRRHTRPISDLDLQLFDQGRHWRIYELLGAREHLAGGVAGVLFAVWAPRAAHICVVGEFNGWDGRAHPMSPRGGGIWELFVPCLAAGVAYKYELTSTQGETFVKSDPFGRSFQLRPQTAAIVEPAIEFEWGDAEWLRQRADFDWQHLPISIYEVHLGSWQRGPAGEMLGYREIAPRLVAHAQSLGFTHIELMPVTEHPLDESWGYQTTGYFAPTSRFGSPDDFRWFVDFCHASGMGVILDWVPAHFPKDAHALGRFDGEALFENPDPRLGENRDWGTFVFDFGRNEVRNFLIASALFWLEEFHVDGLRVDAVSSMLHLGYPQMEWGSIQPGYEGQDNPEAIRFMRELNEVTHQRVPGALIMAEDSSAWPLVTRPTYMGGLGFDVKWNMGWMNDTLHFMARDAADRRHHQGQITFSIHYAFKENFLLPLSHDEVVHCKKSLLHKMPGSNQQRFANLRLLYVYMFTHPGKKLLFMGDEFAQHEEWNCNAELAWQVRDEPFHHGLERLVGALNGLYRNEPALHGLDFDPQGFAWLCGKDTSDAILAYLRRSGDEFVVVALNLTPLPRGDFRLGVPEAGTYREIMNSDASDYAGGGMGNHTRQLVAEEKPWMGQPYSLLLTLPPLTGIVLALAPTQAPSIHVLAEPDEA